MITLEDKTEKMPMSTAVGANSKVVLALIGAGGRGTSVILGMVDRNENVEVKYVCEVDGERGGKAIDSLTKKQGYAPKRVEDMRTVFDDKDVDGVVIATPEHWHALASIWACQAGKHVYVEKNVSMSIEEGRRMIQATKRYNRFIMCGTQNRSAPYMESAKEYIKSGKLGDIVKVNTYCLLSGGSPWILKPGSAVPPKLNWDRWLGPAKMVDYTVSRHKAWYDWWAYATGQHFGGDASHVVDLARAVLGDPEHPKSVYCAGGRYLYDDKKDVPDLQAITYDYGNFVMTCQSGKFGRYMSKSKGDVRYGNKFPDWMQNSTRIEILGTKAMMYVGRQGGGWQVKERDGKVVAHEYGIHPDKWHQVNFIESIRSGKLVSASIDQGHLSASLIHLGNYSFRAGNKQLLFDGKTEKITNNNEIADIVKVHYRKGYELPDIV